ncbi:hypothetical protein [Pandoraea soli]
MTNGKQDSSKRRFIPFPLDRRVSAPWRIVMADDKFYKISRQYKLFVFY